MRIEYITMRLAAAACMTVLAWAEYCPSVRAETPVALELVLAVDASSSVDDAEYALQVAGYVKAFRDPDIVAAIKKLKPAGIAVTYVEWSDRWQQVQSVAWTHVDGEASAAAFSSAIAAQSNMLQGSGTALGTAISYSTGLFAGNGFRGLRQVIDVSADDRYNSGSHPSLSRDRAVAQNITVNALAVDKSGKLASYFKQHVIGGPDAFVMTANSFEDFEVSIKAKLLRELGAIGLISSAGRPDQQETD